MGDQTRSRLVETTRAAMDADPGWTQRMRAAMPPLEVIAQASAEARAVTDSLPQVRAARAAGAREAQPKASAARRQAVLERAGFSTMSEAVEAVAGLSVPAAAVRLGVGRTTVRRWRSSPRRWCSGDPSVCWSEGWFVSVLE